MQNLRKLVGSEQNILSSNKLGSLVEAIGTCILTLSNDFILKLERTFYVIIFSRILIPISRLIPFGYSFNFKDTSFELLYNVECFGKDILFDGLYLRGL